MAENTNVTYTADGAEVLFFDIGDTVYGIEIKYINEIIGIEQITVVRKYRNGSRPRTICKIG